LPVNRGREVRPSLSQLSSAQELMDHRKSDALLLLLAISSSMSYTLKTIPVRVAPNG
jgi:hypothetical protein